MVGLFPFLWIKSPVPPQFVHMKRATQKVLFGSVIESPTLPTSSSAARSSGLIRCTRAFSQYIFKSLPGQMIGLWYGGKFDSVIVYNNERMDNDK